MCGSVIRGGLKNVHTERHTDRQADRQTCKQAGTRVCHCSIYLGEEGHDGRDQVEGLPQPAQVVLWRADAWRVARVQTNYIRLMV